MSQMVHDAGSPEIGDLATPINSSGFSRALIKNLPAYRAGLSPQRRGLEVGMAHGYFLYGPFMVLGPLRLTEHAGTAGLLATLGLISILTICLSLYGYAGSAPSVQPAGVTVANPPANLFTREGWSEFTSGFLIGACGGAFFAFLLCSTSFVKQLMVSLPASGV